MQPVRLEHECSIGRRLEYHVHVTVPIAVSGLTKFGWYRGTIEFRETKIKPGGGTIIPLSILVRGAIIIPTPRPHGVSLPDPVELYRRRAHRADDAQSSDLLKFRRLPPELPARWI